MSWLQRLADRLWKPFTATPCRPGDVGMSEAEFLLAVLDHAPIGSRINFNQDEPEAWVDALKTWHHPLEGHLEAKHYDVNREFVERLKQLLADEATALEKIPHLYLEGPAGERLLDSLDHFRIVHLDPSIRRALDGFPTDES